MAVRPGEKEFGDMIAIKIPKKSSIVYFDQYSNFLEDAREGKGAGVWKIKFLMAPMMDDPLCTNLTSKNHYS